jgi:aldehyde dehydrogenase (NAD+)
MMASQKQYDRVQNYIKLGPVLSILTYKTEEEAIAIANDTDYGLKDDPFAPFDGFKQSGIGRESGVYGLESW